MKILLLIGFNKFNQIACRLFIKSFQISQTLPVLCQTYRNNRHGLCGRVEGRQIRDCTAKNFTVIDTGTEYNLTMKLKIVFLKKPQPVHQVSRIPVSQHDATEFRICCVNRNIKRRSLSFQNPVKLLFRNICQGNIVSHHQAEPPVVVLDVKRFSHSLWKLIHKAEKTAVAAVTGFHGFSFIQAETQRCPLCLTDCIFIRCMIAFRYDFQQPGRRQRLVVYLILNRNIVDGDNPVVRQDPCLIRR